MKLAIASPQPSAYSETFIHAQMERLPCLLRIHGGPVASETTPGGPITPLRHLRGLFDTLVERGLKKKGWEGPHARELARRLRKAHVQVLLANYGPMGVALLPVCTSLQIPLVVHFHGFDAHVEAVVASHLAAYRKLGTEAAAVVAVSEWMSSALCRLGIPKEKIHLARYGADSARFHERRRLPSEPVFFCVGRFVDKKAPYLTLLAFKEVHQTHPTARLVLAGDGILLETTRNLCSALGLDAAVSFPGVLTHAEVAEYMQRATAYVQHSITPQHGPAKGDSEGTPVAILEALASGLPVISTRHAGIGEVVSDHQTGLLVAERDVAGMARAMQEIIEDPDLAAGLGMAARMDALRKYSMDSYIGSLKKILQASVSSPLETSRSG